jgi:hypothetical protein
MLRLETLLNQGVPVALDPRPREDPVGNLCYAFIFILTITWIWSLFLSIKFPEYMWLQIPANYYPGFISYGVGIIFSEIREVF